MSHLYIEGSSQRFTNLSITQASTPISEQLATTSWADVVGSSITYTPRKDCTFVLYEFCTHMGVPSSSPANSKGYFKLLYSDNSGSSWTELTNSRVMYGSDGSSTNTIKLRGQCTLSYIIPYWSYNSRQIKLQVKTFTDYSFGLNKFTHFYNSSGSVSGDHFQRPYVSCSSI